ncbi:gliding motility-associated C-terminal domain-containing protein [Croceitalea marina]|uniref:Gliding motility-associated C-terminal domain-containing protein n=1 Tax=Croceitalea marina TaxID=1775166 RepID=A0ABW5N046_9FLAO
MKKLLHISFLLVGFFATAQTALYNSGNMQLHGNAELGFHTNLINESTFETTSGLVGFYGNNPIQVSGSIAPTLFDAEIFLPSNLFLGTTLNISNNFNFVEGNVLSSLNNQVVYLNFLDNTFFTGENDASKVTGFAAITNKTIFSFPVGDQSQLRPLMLESDSNNELAICAYLRQDPSNPSAISENFDIEEKVRNIGAITDKEFWILQGDVPSTVTLSWNPESDLVNLGNTVEDIILVGWSKTGNLWTVIGNTAFSGDLNQGFLVSEKFVPSDYAAITFGTVPLPLDTFAVNNPTLGNYFVSPNGDGINDVLIIDNLGESESNNLQIYNRFGQKVFEMDNYSDEFNGFSNQNNLVINKSQGLAEGVYFYIVTLFDLELNYQGFLFLDK